MRCQSAHDEPKTEVAGTTCQNVSCKMNKRHSIANTGKLRFLENCRTCFPKYSENPNYKYSRAGKLTLGYLR